MAVRQSVEVEEMSPSDEFGQDEGSLHCCCRRCCSWDAALVVVFEKTRMMSLSGIATGLPDRS